jgi:HEPN domain-containing protein
VNKPGNDIIGKSRSELLQATMMMDEGKFREASEKCVESSALALQAVLVAWDLSPQGSSCWDMLTIIGQNSPAGISSELRSLCKKVDRFSVFYKDIDEAGAENIFDEEFTMEMINYGREILKFAQRNLRRGEPDDQPEILSDGSA